MHKRRPAAGPALVFLDGSVEVLLSRRNHRWRSAFYLGSIKYGIGSQMRRPGGQQLLFAINQIARVKRCQLKTVSMRDGVRWARLHTVAAENTPIVVDVINLGVTLGAAHPVLSGVLCRLDVNEIGRASCRERVWIVVVQRVMKRKMYALKG